LLEKICTALGVTLSQFFQEGNSENLTEKTEKSSRACLKNKNCTNQMLHFPFS
jgi:hypothetical protein